MLFTYSEEAAILKVGNAMFRQTKEAEEGFFFGVFFGLGVFPLFSEG